MGGQKWLLLTPRVWCLPLIDRCPFVPQPPQRPTSLSDSDSSTAPGDFDNSSESESEPDDESEDELALEDEEERPSPEYYLQEAESPNVSQLRQKRYSLKTQERLG